MIRLTRSPARPAALLVVSLLFIPLRASADPYKDMAKQLGKMSAKHLKEKKIAILPFDYADKRSSPGGWSVAERLIGRFVERGEYTVVERSLVEKVLGELKFQSTGVVDPETAQKIGRGLGVPAVVTGTLESLPEGKVRINARMIEVETLKIVGAVEREVEQTWSDQPAAAPPPAGAKTPSYNEVAAAYLEHLRSGRFDNAYSLLTKKARIHVRPEDFANYETIFRNRTYWDITQIRPPVSHKSGDFVQVWLGVPGLKNADGSESLERTLWLHSEEGEWGVAYVDSLETGAIKAGGAGDHRKAVTLISNACEIAPVGGFAWRLLSKECLKLAGATKDGKVYVEPAVRAGREAVRLGKTVADAWETLGEALLMKAALQQPGDGKAIVSQAEVEALLMKALQSDAGKVIGAEAEEAFSTALSLVATPDNYNDEEMMVNALLFRAVIREAQGRFKEALADVRKARVGTPEDVLKSLGVNPQSIEFIRLNRDRSNVELKRVEQRLLGKLGKKPGAP